MQLRINILRTLLAIGVTPSLYADSVVKLSDGDRLSGQLESINDKGNAIVRVNSSTTPVEIVGDHITEIEFSPKEHQKLNTSERVTLINGDELPCSIKSLDHETLKIDTWYAGAFTVSTDVVKHIQFHTSPELLTYSGPINLEEWTQISNWKVLPNNLFTSEKGDIGREFNLPTNFIFKCNIKWESSRPRFKIWFCGDSDEAAKNNESYFMDFNANGVQIARSSKTQKRNQFGELPVKLKDVSPNNIALELRVDRKCSQITVLINNEPMGVYNDTSLMAPTGSFFNFESNMQNGNSLNLSDIKIHEWSGNAFSSKESHDKLNKSRDTIYDNEGLSFTGKLVGIQSKENSSYLLFKSEHAKENLQVPLSKLQSVYFAESSTTKKTTAPKFQISIHGGGSLAVSSLNLANDKATSMHPILGEIILNTEAFSRITSKKSNNE